MDKTRKPRKTAAADQGKAWETRHDNDARGPLADNPSDMPDRAARMPEGAAGESNPVHASGYQAGADAVHPNFPDQGEASMGADRPPEEHEAIRRRAYELWQQEGSPEDSHQRHWLQAERELRGDGG